MRSGFTLLELAIVLGVLSLLMMLIIPAAPKYVNRAKDAKTKDNFAKYKVVMEDYYNDNGCYPPNGILDTCGGTQLQPYLTGILCDDKRVPYVYVSASSCKSYAIYGKLRVTDDPDITRVGCSNGCGPGKQYNYGVSNTKLE